jgi:Fe-S cluster biogenesis protein NfuA/nitrite reductase/ring-hydroxylating ferredoxin subunit
MVSTSPNGAPREHEAPEDQSVAATAARVEALLASAGSVSTPRQAQELADELARNLVTLYGAGLERILTIAYESLGERSEELFARLCDDPFVEGLLSLHDLHPVPVEERVQRALEGVRPYLKSHAGGITLLGARDGVALLRLEGTCDGCPSSTATVKLAVERAIIEAVPEIREVRVEGVTTGSGSLRIESDWLSLAGIPELAEHGIAACEIAGTSVLLITCEETLYAYRNRCAACASRLEGARVESSLVRCPSCGTAFDLVHAGRASGEDPIFIEPFPLRREDGRIRVAIPVGV